MWTSAHGPVPSSKGGMGMEWSWYEISGDGMMSGQLVWVGVRGRDRP